MSPASYRREQRTGSRHGGKPTHAMGGRLRAMGSAERIHYVDVAERGHTLRQGFVIGLLADVETDVLAHEDTAGLHLDAVQPLFRQRDGFAEQPGEMGGHT